MSTTTAAAWLTAAQKYIARGWAVVPLHNPTGNPKIPCSCRREDCGKPAKHPRTYTGTAEATCDPSQVREWAQEFPYSNLGIVLQPSGIVTVSPDSLQWAATFEERGLPAGPRFNSGGGEGHWHHLLQLPAGAPVHRLCRSGEYDILSNGLVVAPPSLHVSGRSYQWIEEPEWYPELPLAPEWVVALLQTAAAASGIDEREWLARRREQAGPNAAAAAHLSLIELDYWSGRRRKTKPDGAVNRSDTLMAIACELAAERLSRAEIVGELLDRDTALGFEKFSGRKDGGESEYARMADKALHRVETDPPRRQFAAAVPLASDNGRGAGATADPEPAGDRGETIDGPPPPVSRILTRKEMRQRPPVRWRVEKRIPRRGVVCFYGPPGAGKTICVTDLCERVTYGGSWNGAAVEPGPVLYLAAEGADGVNARQRAWESDTGGEPLHELYTLPLRVNFLQAREVSALLEEIRVLPVKPAVIAIDTLNRCFVGGDEVSGKDMGLFVDVCDRLKEQFDCVVVVVHHMNAAGERERGHGSLRGAADTMIAVTQTAGIVNVHCDYQKDAEPFADLAFSLVPIGDSVVLGKPGAAVGKLTLNEIMLLQALAECDSPLRLCDLEKASDLPERALRGTVRALQAGGYINRVGKKRSPLGGYELTFNGREYLARSHANQTDDSLAGTRTFSASEFQASEPLDDDGGGGLKIRNSDGTRTPASGGEDPPFQAQNGASPPELGQLGRNSDAGPSELRKEGVGELVHSDTHSKECPSCTSSPQSGAPKAAESGKCDRCLSLGRPAEYPVSDLKSPHPRPPGRYVQYCGLCRVERAEELAASEPEEG